MVNLFIKERRKTPGFSCGECQFIARLFDVKIIREDLFDYVEQVLLACISGRF